MEYDVVEGGVANDNVISGLQLMSDPYVFEDLMDELNQAASSADTE